VRGAISADGTFAAGVAGSTRKTAPKNTNGIRVKSNSANNLKLNISK
jgi:hypothetical protein